MSIRYISDCHWNHKNILRYDNRPWKNTEDMEFEMIQLWNKTVDPKDEVFILGGRGLEQPLRGMDAHPYVAERNSLHRQGQP